MSKNCAILGHRKSLKIKNFVIMEPLHKKKLKFIEEIANRLRQDVIEMVSRAGSGHIAGPLDMAEIFATLYFHILRHYPKYPDWPKRDRVVLSNGHICPILYAALARAGYFPLEELKTLRQIGSRLQGHPHRKSLPGIETTSGPLGSGLSQACGIALAARLDNKKYRIYCLMSDAEHQEGNTWEAAMFAGKNRLSNITAVIDRNNIQISGFTENVMPLEPLKAKYEAFNWHVLEINGHNPQDFVDAVAEAQAIYEKPTVIIAHTIAGKGVSFMERNYSWHSRPFGPGEAEHALKELRTLHGKIEAGHE
jgi:transketolase